MNLQEWNVCVRPDLFLWPQADRLSNVMQTFSLNMTLLCYVSKSITSWCRKQDRQDLKHCQASYTSERFLVWLMHTVLTFTIIWLRMDTFSQTVFVQFEYDENVIELMINCFYSKPYWRERVTNANEGHKRLPFEV